MSIHMSKSGGFLATVQNDQDRSEVAAKLMQAAANIAPRGAGAIENMAIGNNGYVPPKYTNLSLPVNGTLPGDRNQRYKPFNRVGKLRCFSDDQTAFDCGQWFKAVTCRLQGNGIDQRAEDHCSRVGLDIVNTAYEGSGPDGGYLVPAPLSTAIIEVRERVGVSRQVCQIQPTSSDTVTVPKRTGGLTVYYPNELQTMTPSDKAWSLVALSLRKRAVVSKLSQELSDDAVINLIDNITTEMAYALALQEDNELINGTGASTYGGVTGLLAAIGSAGVSTATGHSTWSALDLADVTAMIGKLPDRFHIFGPGFICSHSFYNQVLLRLAYAAGGTTMAEVMGGAGTVRQFMGYPVYMTPWMPTATATSSKCLLFGSFSQAAILADRGGVRIARSDDVGFLEDVITLKAVQRTDINVHEPGNSSNAGAYVALATASG